MPQIDVNGAVDDQTQRPFVIVFAHIDHSPGKIAVHHARHGDEKLIGQIDGVRCACGHAQILDAHADPHRLSVNLKTMSESNLSALVWFRRDLRCVDHAALYHALKNNRRVWCAFVFDSDILELLPRQDRRVAFICDSLI